MVNPMLTIASECASEFQFDVAISGTDVKDAKVRFILENVNGFDVTINCTKAGPNRWAVNFPALPINEKSKNFRVEVITEGFYFCPTMGQVNITHTPKVSEAEFTNESKKQRPIVSTNFTDSTVLPQKKLIEIATMTSKNKLEMMKQIETSGTVLSKAGDLLLEIANENAKITSEKLKRVLDLVQNSLNNIESKIYL